MSHDAEMPYLLYFLHIDYPIVFKLILVPKILEVAIYTYLCFNFVFREHTSLYLYTSFIQKQINLQHVVNTLQEELFLNCVSFCICLILYLSTDGCIGLLCIIFLRPASCTEWHRFVVQTFRETSIFIPRKSRTDACFIPHLILIYATVIYILSAYVSIRSFFAWNVLHSTCTALLLHWIFMFEEAGSMRIVGHYALQQR